MNTVTRIDVLTAIVEKNWDFLSSEDAQTVASKMLASLEKARNKADKKAATPSKAALENEKLAHDVAMIMPENEVVLTSWIMEHVAGIATPQKCTKVMAVLIEKNRVEKIAKVKGKYVGYKLIQRNTYLMSNRLPSNRKSIIFLQKSS